MQKTTFPQPFRTPDGRDLFIDIARQEENKEIMDFYVLHFCSKPPVRQICEYDELQGDSNQLNWMREDVTRGTEQPLSLLVRDASGRLVGVLLNEIKKRPADDEKPSGTDSKLSRLLDAYEESLSDGVDLFELLKTDSILRQYGLAVSSEFARQGLATKLYQLSLDIAMDLGFKAVMTKAASTYTVKLAAKLGYESFKTVAYASIEHNGTRPFTNFPDMLVDHPSVSLMGRRLP